ncbi:MAG: DUF1844 domain-containing protein [Planctomycetaceae bacterium]|nr:MAG: DUF1844 domain-containing protein [Planctomycetaceae bacterium]
MADEEKKIIIDEDWKREAQREKDKLAAQEAVEKKKEEAEGPKRGPRGLPRGDLAGLVSMLTTQAIFALGLIQIKGEEDREPDLELARYNIDMLEAIGQKTKGNLTPEEEELLKNTLSDLRMGYVNIANQLASQQ